MSVLAQKNILVGVTGLELQRDLLIFPNYLMHTAYPFNISAERRSFSFNVKIIFKK